MSRSRGFEHEQRNRLVEQEKARAADRRKQLDAAAQRAGERKVALQERAADLAHQRDRIEDQLRRICSGGERLASSFEALGRLSGITYGPGVGPLLSFDGKAARVEPGVLEIGGKTIGDRKITNMQWSCCPAAYRALELAFGGQLPFRDGGAERRLDVRKDPAVAKFYETWNSFDGERPLLGPDPRGPIQAIEDAGLGLEVAKTNLREIERGDLVQTRDYNATTKQWGGHVFVVTNVDRVHQTVTLISALPSARKIDTVVRSFAELERWRKSPDWRLYVGRIYDDVGQMGREPALQKERDEIVGRQKEVARHQGYGELVERLDRDGRLARLPDDVYRDLIDAATLVPGDRYREMTERLRELPEVVPEGAVRAELKGAIGAPLDQAALERDALVRLGHREESIQAMERRHALIQRQIAELPPTFQNIDKIAAWKQSESHYAADVPLAHLLVRQAERRTLAAGIDECQRVLARHASQSGAAVIDEYLRRLKLGLTAEQLDLSLRSKQIEDEVMNAWDWTID